MKKSVRWLPAVIAPALIVAGAITIPAVANAATTLPDKTPQQVLAMIAGAKDAAYSGTVEQSSDLGLPQLPSTGSGSRAGSDSTSQLLDLLTADHSARIFVDGAQKQRVQVLDQLAERDVIRNGSQLWTYDSKTKTATHSTRSPSDATPAPSAAPSTEALSPAQLADRFIQAIEPSTTLHVTSTARVAGRAVYQLALAPRSGTTLVAGVTLSVDGKTGVPLKVVVDARGQKSDAFSVGFRSIDFSTPAAELFRFAPPAGTTVTTPTKPAKPGPVPNDPDKGAVKPSVTGSGWDSIVELPADTATKVTGSSQSKLLGELTTAVPGGRALQTSLISVLLMTDGRVLLGAVPIATLEAAAR